MSIVIITQLDHSILYGPLNMVNHLYWGCCIFVPPNYVVPKFPNCIHRGCDSHQNRAFLQSVSFYVPTFLKEVLQRVCLEIITEPVHNLFQNHGATNAVKEQVIMSFNISFAKDTNSIIHQIEIKKPVSCEQSSFHS